MTLSDLSEGGGEREGERRRGMKGVQRRKGVRVGREKRGEEGEEEKIKGDDKTGRR